MEKQKYLTRDVFTPGRPAHKSFIERSEKINDVLVDALMTPGKQIVIYGHSGTGKSSLILNKLEQLYERSIITSCMEGMGFENIVLNAFDQLNNYYCDETTLTKGIKIKPTFTASYQDIKTSFNALEFGKSSSTKTKRVIPPQLTLQRLAEFLGEINCCWVLEDFHKVKPEDKKKISQSMKIFMDASVKYPDIKIIALGAVGTAREVVEYDKEMNNRVSEIYVPLMSSDELRDIIEKGEKLLNVKFKKEIKEEIIKFSCGLPSICHQLCLNICFERRIYETTSKLIDNSINSNVDTPSFGREDFNHSVEKYLNEKSDSFKSEFDKALLTDSRRKINKAKIILQCIIELKLEEFYLKDIIKFIDKAGYAFTSEEIITIIREFTTAIRSEILIYDNDANVYRFNNIFLKAYCKLRFDSESKSESDIRSNQKRIIRKLLDAIEEDADKDLFDIVNSDSNLFYSDRLGYEGDDEIF